VLGLNRGRIGKIYRNGKARLVQFGYEEGPHHGISHFGGLRLRGVAHGGSVDGMVGAAAKNHRGEF
jgi:hypothetical protein